MATKSASSTFSSQLSKRKALPEICGGKIAGNVVPGQQPAQASAPAAEEVVGAS